MIMAYLQMIIALAAVVGLIFLMAFFVRKKQGATGGMMKIIGYQSLGQRKGVVALKVNSDVLLLGVTPSEVRLLKSYEDGELKAEPVKEHDSKLKKLRLLKESLYEPK